MRTIIMALVLSLASLSIGCEDKPVSFGDRPVNYQTEGEEIELTPAMANALNAARSAK
jgi:hypothetical protein